MSVIQCAELDRLLKNSNGTNETLISDWSGATVVDGVVIPLELFFGFFAQLLNLWVLQGSKIRSSTYTVYLRGLSVTYLITIIFTATSVLRKLRLISNTSYIIMFYYAHFEFYFQNAFLFSGNLIVAALALESFRGMICPFTALYSAASNRRGIVILLLCYAITLIILSPLPFVGRVEGPVEVTGTYCYRRLNVVRQLRYAIAGIFEVALLLIVLVLNFAMFTQYRKIVSKHKMDVQKMTMSSSRVTKASSSRKAVLICLGSVTAYSISNAPSALKESLYLANVLTQSQWLKTVLQGQLFNILRQFANLALLANFTLAVLMQYILSAQYQMRMHKCFGRLKRYLMLLCRCKSADNNIPDRANYRSSGNVPQNGLLFKNSLSTSTGQERSKEVGRRNRMLHHAGHGSFSTVLLTVEESVRDNNGCSDSSTPSSHTPVTGSPIPLLKNVYVGARHANSFNNDGSGCHHEMHQLCIKDIERRRMSYQSAKKRDHRDTEYVELPV